MEDITSRFKVGSTPLNINELEMLTLLMMVATFRSMLKNKTIMMECDNKVTVDALNNSSATTPTLRAMTRVLHLMSADINTEFKVVHIKGERNITADELSRDSVPNILQSGERCRVEKGYLKQYWMRSEM